MSQLPNFDIARYLLTGHLMYRNNELLSNKELDRLRDLNWSDKVEAIKKHLNVALTEGEIIDHDTKNT